MFADIKVADTEKHFWLGKGGGSWSSGECSFSGGSVFLYPGRSLETLSGGGGD